MLAYYGTQLSPHMDKTPEGYLICRDVPIARTGPQDYLARELQLEGDPDRVVTVNRHPEDVFDAAALASFEGKDVTAGHPPENVGPENHAAYSKGHVQHVRRDGEHIIADLIIKDAALVSDVWNGVTREVSCGYMCQYVPDGDGFKQQHTHTITGEMAQHWRADSQMVADKTGMTFVTTLENRAKNEADEDEGPDNDKGYASYVNDGHRVDKHFVRGLYVDENGILTYDPEAKDVGLVVGTQTKYVPGLYMKEAAIEKYQEVAEAELKKLAEEAFQ